MSSRSELGAHHAAGGVLTGSSAAPGGSGLRQTVGVHPEKDGRARVHVETYEPTEWDTEVESFDREFDDLDAALAWLAAERGIAPSQLNLQPIRPS